MTMLRGAIITFLKDALDDVGVYPVRRPIEDEALALTVNYVSDYSEHAHAVRGPQLTEPGPDGLIRRRVQIDVWGPDHDSVDVLAGQVQSALDGYRGPMGDTISIGSCMKDNEFDADDPATRAWRRIQDYQFAYNEAAAGS